MGSKSKGFWRETGRKIALNHKRMAQRHAVAYPVLFALAWLVKVLLWDVPRAIVRVAVVAATGRVR